jgi:ribonucleotide reductase alpha subunit
MKIVKRDGSSQSFMPNKILSRIKEQSKGLKVDTTALFQQVIPLIQDNMTTTEIDELIAFKSADKVLEHPDYSLLGGRILLSRQSKLINKPMQEVDYTYDFFSAETFLTKYSKKENKKYPVELPSCMYRRVADYLGTTDEERELIYNDIVSKKSNFATPTYTNAGIDNRNGMISCNLTHLKEDSIAGIEETLTKISYGSKEGSGIGLLIDNLRSEESEVSSFNDTAGGVVRFADMVQSKMRFYKQGSRSGSCALYLSVWHKDILRFLELRLPVGDEKLRTRDLFTAVVINDLFMDKLLNGGDWYVFCPNDIKKAGLRPLYDLSGIDFETEYQKAVDLGIGKAINPKKIWDSIIKSQVESGTPYTMFKDNANRRNMQDNIGIIKSSNLCVSENTLIDFKIEDELHVTDIKTLTELFKLENSDILVKSYNIDTGEIEYNQLLAAEMTNTSAEVLEITDEMTGKSILCTPEHKVFTENRGYVMAKDLVETDILKIFK